MARLITLDELREISNKKILKESTTLDGMISRTS